MKTISGTISNLRHTINVSGGGEDYSVRTTHISLFQIDRQAIKVQSTQPLMINEGDNMIVVGPIKKGVLHGLAHKNLTTSVEDHEGWIAQLIIGILIPCIAIFMLHMFTSLTQGASKEVDMFTIMSNLFAVIFFAFGIYSIFSGVRVLQALGQLRKEQ
jgi:ACR3 family arsenite efflux pump ArsB